MRSLLLRSGHYSGCFGVQFIVHTLVRRLSAHVTIKRPPFHHIPRRIYKPLQERGWERPPRNTLMPGDQTVFPTLC